MLGIGLGDVASLGRQHVDAGSIIPARDVHESALDGRPFPSSILALDPKRGVGQADQQRRVTDEDPDIALDAVRDDHLRGSRPDLALGRDHVDLERGHPYAACFIFSAAWTASSTPPTRRNACSGRWSYSPSVSARNDAMVSSTGTYLPGIPVNCSATKNGCDRNSWIRRALATMTLSSSDSSSTPRMAMMSWRSL